MESSTTIKENTKTPLELICKQQLFEHWQKNAPKLMFGEHQLLVELNEVDEFFIEKAKEELRETPEIVAENLKELKELLAGSKSLIVQKMLSLYCVFRQNRFL